MALFPACAGVILKAFNYPSEFGAFPRMRGGDPIPSHDRETPGDFSPHARG